MKLRNSLTLILLIGNVLVSAQLVAQDNAHNMHERAINPDSQVNYDSYGSTNFDATGSAAAHKEFLLGLLRMHNFEYTDARMSFQKAQEIDPDFTMAYWGEALSYEHYFWHRSETEKSRAVLAKLGSTLEQRAKKASTQREKDYLQSIEILFGEGSQQEREVAYSDALYALHKKYPEDLDAAAFYALSILATTYGGRDFSRYMQAAAVTEDILVKNPRHPGALHYNIHSYDDPIHAPLGLRAAKAYYEVAPAAVHALHMVSHIYYALGAWEEGVEANIRSYGESVKRQADPDDLYDHQGYHSLTWIPYGYQQMGRPEEARKYIALIAKQVERYGSVGHMSRQNYVTTRASYIVDTQEWGSQLADVKIDHTGLSPYAVATDYYVQGLVALNRGNIKGAKDALQNMGSGELITKGKRTQVAPGLLRLALQGQIEIAVGNAEKGLVLIQQAEAIEAVLPSEYGPAVPVQPMPELLADVYRELGDTDMAQQYYQFSLQRAVGRNRSITGLSKITE